MTAVVLGADCGGTATRVVAATVDGRVLGRGRAGAGNPVVRPPEQTAAALTAAVTQALAGVEPARVAGAVVALAGAARLAEADAATAYADAWRAAGLRCPLRPVGDAVAAFAAGTSEASGTILIAGTGAVAAEIVDGAVGRRVDGLGWLLGDEGSGFWLGVHAARRTARAVAAGAVLGALDRAVCDRIGTEVADGFVTAFYALSRDEVAGLAPLVVAAARDGDPAAAGLLDDAADRLAQTLAALHPRPGPVVLAGGLLTGVPEVADRVQDRLRRRIGRPGVRSGDAAAAAAWLAAREFAGPSPVDVAALHRALVRPRT